MKNQGISLITLIITIIVIIILAAIVIFTGLGTPDSAQLASFTQQVDNVYSAVLNKYAELYLAHNLSGEYRTKEQIYIEIAAGADRDSVTSGVTGTTRTMTMVDDCININPTNSADMTNKFSAHIVLPKINNEQDDWYVTEDGAVFNQNGFVHDGKVYFNGYTYEIGDTGTASAAEITAAIKADSRTVTHNG